MAKVIGRKEQLRKAELKRKNNMRWIRRIRSDIEHSLKEKGYSVAAQYCEDLAVFLRKQSRLDREIASLKGRY